MKLLLELSKSSDVIRNNQKFYFFINFHEFSLNLEFGYNFVKIMKILGFFLAPNIFYYFLETCVEAAAFF